MTDQLIINTLWEIKEQTGVELTPCDYFTGLKKNESSYTFSALLSDNRISESLDYIKVVNYVKKYTCIRIEPNGVKRIAIHIPYDPQPDNGGFDNTNFNKLS